MRKWEVIKDVQSISVICCKWKKIFTYILCAMCANVTVEQDTAILFKLIVVKNDRPWPYEWMRGMLDIYGGAAAQLRKRPAGWLAYTLPYR